MDVMQNESATTEAEVSEPGAAGTAATEPEALEPEADAEPAQSATAAESEESAEPAQSEESAEPADASAPPEVPQPRAVEPEPASKAKKRKTAPRAAKSAAGTKALVVFREGRLHYADESVVVLDLDEAAHPDTDVHDVVDKLSELRDAAESTGRTEAITLVADLIQAKALA